MKPLLPVLVPSVAGSTFLPDTDALSPSREPRADAAGYQTRFSTVRIPNTGPLLIRSLLDRQQYHDPDGEAERLGISPALWPLFGLLWPSAVQLAAHVALRPVNPAERILEIGCGLALPSLVAHRQGADVTASDCHPLAKTFLKANLALNDLPPTLEYRHGQWGADMQGKGTLPNRGTLQGKYDLILGSDLLYERGAAPQIARFVATHAHVTAEAWIVDAGRGYRSAFDRHMMQQGFDLVENILLTQTSSRQGKPPYKGRLLKYARGRAG